jgi:transcriptional regulator with XRE-family HTH domain
MTDRQVRLLRAKMLGALMRELRLESGKSLKETASLIGTTSSTLSSYEHGRKSISLPELELLAYHLDVPLRFFTSPSLMDREEGPDFDPSIMVSLRQRMIAAMIRKRRSELGISINALGEAVDMPASRISTYEKGLRPIPIPDLESILTVLEQDLGEYIDTEGPIGQWYSNQVAFENFLGLPSHLRQFFMEPGNEAYLQLAVNLSKFSLHDIRAVVEALEGITK